MLILGIDPGTAILGYGLVESARGSRLVAHEYGAITTSSKARMQDRLLKLYDGMDALIKKHKPDAVAIEQLFMGRNVTTAIPVAQARGLVLLAAAKNGLDIIEETPVQVKQMITGNGRAKKEQVIYMAQHLLALSAPPKPDDAADALAIAIGALHLMENPIYRNELLHQG